MPRLIIVAKNFSFRKTLAFMTQHVEGLEFAGEFENGLEALKHIPVLAPNIVLMDVLISDTEGIALIHLIQQTYPAIQIMVITDSLNNDMTHQAVQAGASWVVFKDNFNSDTLQSLLLGDGERDK